jgi:tRNA-dihydrouridine synthase C
MILLAPMEGLLDFTLRDVLTRVGGVDRCVSEFIRITGALLPDRVFTRIIPELENNGCTPAGVPVRPQLLGSDPVCLAENAAKLAALGPPGIDLNFGCPSKAVNRHRGGAVLLDEPELLQRIVSAVRRAVPRALPVSAKMRLGYQDHSRMRECALAIQDGGASELVVHARTKSDGYRPPAYWGRIAEIRTVVTLPVIANGEIWTVDDASRCREASGCVSLMLGRGMVADPGLALAIRNHDVDAPPTTVTTVPWRVIAPLLPYYCQLVARKVESRHQAGRIKQWVNYLRRCFPEAQAAYAKIRTVNDPVEVARLLET